ncbi:hypothetical protein BSKO_09330 [Bryopsis sp. KO-2023]|nr:hypothetical protein BSKO_09330 [Bryopsis sp. KO-2023]
MVVTLLTLLVVAIMLGALGSMGFPSRVVALMEVIDDHCSVQDPTLSFFERVWALKLLVDGYYRGDFADVPEETIEDLEGELERERERHQGLLEHVDQLDHMIELQDRKILYWERSRSEGIRFCNGEIRSEQAKLRSEKGKLREARENLDMDTEWLSEEKVVLKDQQEALVRKEKLLGVMFVAMVLRSCGVDRANVRLFGGGGNRRA